MSRSINKFIKPELIPEFVRLCREAGLSVIVTRTDTTLAEQTALYAQNREPLDVVNRIRRQAGMAGITEKENSYKVTWTMRSRHLPDSNGLSHAFDFGVIYVGKYMTDVKADVDKDNIPDYLECAIIGEKLGLKSGRTFPNPDYPHLEYRGGVK